MDLLLNYGPSCGDALASGRRREASGARARDVDGGTAQRKQHHQRGSHEREQDRRLNRQVEAGEVDEKENAASRTPKPFSEIGSIWTTNEIGTMTARSHSDSGM